MKKTIITTLKFLKNKLEIEAVEQINVHAISIFKNSINSLENDDYQQKLFIKNSKNEIERLIKGKISDVIVLVSTSSDAKLLVETKCFSIPKILDADFTTYNNMIEQMYANKNKKIIKNVNINFVEKTKNVELISIISSLDLEFEQKIYEFAMQNDLTVAQILNYEEAKINCYDAESINLYVDLSENSLALSLINNKNIIINSSFNLGSSDFVNKIMSKYNLNMPMAYFMKNLVWNNNYVDLMTNNLSQGILKNEIYEFYNFILQAITNFVNQNNLNSNFERLNINFYGDFKNNLEIEKYAKIIFNKQNVYSLASESEFISDEMLGMIALLNANDQKSMLTTDTFTIDSNILRNIKISKRKSIFV